MTIRESLVISAYTDFMIGNDFGKVHEYIEEIRGRQVFTHELASEETHKEIQEKSKKEFIEIINNIKG